mgnify:CR=1 FL=1
MNDIFFDAGWIKQAVITENEPLLFPVKRYVPFVLYGLSRIRIGIEKAVDYDAPIDGLGKYLGNIVWRNAGIEYILGMYSNEGSTLA